MFLVFCVFESVVCPQIAFRLSAYLVFKVFEVYVGQFVVGKRRRIVVQRCEDALVIASLHSSCVDKDGDMAEVLGYLSGPTNTGTVWFRNLT